MNDAPTKRTVVMDHDGAVDDALALMMTLSMSRIEVVGVVVTPGDCYLPSAVSTTRKILRLFRRLHVEVASSTLPAVNEFPDAWRLTSCPIDSLPILNESADALPPFSPEPGHEFLARLLQAAPAPVTMLVTGPLTNLAAVLRGHPDLASKIEELVWMGGALAVPGNVRVEGRDGSAEWNAYWDPPAVQQVWQSSMPITLVPLDATNQVPLGRTFLLDLARQRSHRVSDLAGQCLALTVGPIPLEQYQYFMWDGLAAGYLGAPQLLTFRDVPTEVVTTGPSAGRIAESATSTRFVRAVEKVYGDAFLGYVLALLKR